METLFLANTWINVQQQHQHIKAYLQLMICNLHGGVCVCVCISAQCRHIEYRIAYIIEKILFSMTNKFISVWNDMKLHDIHIFNEFLFNTKLFTTLKCCRIWSIANLMFSNETLASLLMYIHIIWEHFAQPLTVAVAVGQLVFPSSSTAAALFNHISSLVCGKCGFLHFDCQCLSALHV